MDKKLTARLTYEVFDSDGNKIDEVRRNFYEAQESNTETFVSEMYFFAKKCMVSCDHVWDEYFYLPGDDHVKMVLDTSIDTTKGHLDEAARRIKRARKYVK